MEKILAPFLGMLASFYDKKNIFSSEPENLYTPIDYTLKNKGKSIRFSLVLMAEELFNEKVQNSFYGALAIEWFHNFTLIHDDIIDNAPIRRGKTSVCKKWNDNIAILSGDVLMIKAYEIITNNYRGDMLREILTLFNDTATKVCEGQQMDMDFEKKDDIKISEYIKMIEYKTAVLLASSLKLGAVIANANQNDANNIFNFGLNLGIAFQIQDDFLDIFGDEKTLGKKIAGDIIEGKKTFLYLKCLEIADEQKKQKLKSYYQKKNIPKVLELFEDMDIASHTRKEIEKYFEKSLFFLDNIYSPFVEKKENLKKLAFEIMNRNY